MIATWMLSALLFTALLAAAAWCAEAALRTARQPTRWPWLVALAAAVTWPVIAPLARRMLPQSAAPTQVAATLPSISVSGQLPTATSWLPQSDAVLLTLWAMASLVVLVQLVRALTFLARVRRASRPQVVDGVNVLVSEHMGPAVLGIVQPSVLLPASLLDLEEPLRRLILRHEDEHRRAHDPWIVLSSAIALALVPWNLPLWWITSRARLALEVDCDARVLARDGNATQYGKLLLLIAQRQTVTSLAPMLAAYDTHLERRIDAMLPVPSSRRRTKLAAAVIGTIVIGIVACSSRIADIAAPGPEIAKRPAMISADQPYFEFQVEKQVRQVPGTGNLRYPDSLRKANVEGEVLAQFVVGADGKYEDGSFKVLRSDHALFSQAIAAALPNMVFTPAEVGGAKVKQVVQQPFTFAMSTPPAVQPSARTGRSTPVVSNGPLLEFQVEKAARQIPGVGTLRYPDALRSANVEGEVLAQFVVDRDGTVMPGSFKVLRSSNELFTESVKAALGDMRFSPAEVDGKSVRQLLQMPFTFSLSKD